MKKIFYLVLLFLSSAICSNAQVMIGSSEEPDIDAVLELVSNDKLGLLLPRVVLMDFTDPAPLSDHKAGMVVYNEGNEDGSLAAGYYYNNGEQWIRISDSSITAWNSISTRERATNSTEDVFRTGAVAIGETSINQHAEFSVSATNKGVLFPRMTTAARNNIASGNLSEIPDGLLIYNTDEHCYNYFNKSTEEWTSLCGNVAPAEFSLTDCSSALYAGTYKVGETLTSGHAYIIKVYVEKVGSYSISLSTGNGFAFTTSGEFTVAGINQVIILEGQGIPLTATDGTDVSQYTLRFNGKVVTPSCTLPGIPVEGAGGGFTITGSQCENKTVSGTYRVGSLVSASTHYVELTVVLDNASNYIIQATPAGASNGLTFRSDPVSGNGVKVVRLYASGTPQNTGSYSYIISPTDSAADCVFTINVTNDLGTFTNPAQSCLALYNAGVTTDGEYWISTSGGKVKTLCDMTNGGYTLVWSYSERSAYVNTTAPFGTAASKIVMTRKHQLNQDAPRNRVTSESGSINYADFRMSLADMKSVRAAGSGTYRVQINYLPTAMLNDNWGKNFFLEITPNSSSKDFINNEYGATLVRNNYKMNGMYFGKPMVSTGTGSFSYNGQELKTSVGHWHNKTYYATHIDVGYIPFSSTVQFSTTLQKHPDDGGAEYSYTVKSNQLNNLFGWFGESEADHSFGKCGSDDYMDGGTATHGCTGSSKQVHSFNNGEGRYLQWWVK